MTVLRPLRVLLIEASETQAASMLDHLRQGGYDPICERVETAEQVPPALERQHWDLVIADYAMTQASGSPAVSVLRSRGLEAPFIFVSGASGEEAAVAAMKMGADDYILKDNLTRLVPAIDRELRDAELRRERAKTDERARHLAYYDGLTDLANRTLFQNRLEQAVSHTLRDRRPLAVLILDLIAFRDLNERLGRLAGDEVLRQVGQRLRSGLRDSDTVARLGGDEFAILLPAVGKTGAEMAARKLLRVIQVPMVAESLTVDVTAGVGIALCPEHGTEADVLMQRADVARRAAKADGSGVRTYAPALDRESPERLEIGDDLRHAIARDELVLRYQPAIHLVSGAMLGVEALAWWKHPRYGLMSPDQFMPIAEQTGAVRPLTFWVLERALHQWQQGRDAGVDLVTAVHLSDVHLEDTHLTERIGELLQLLGAPASALEFEVNESVINADPVRALQVLSRLGSLGAKVAISDFGTGYSSFGSLGQVQVHAIKIGHTFMAGDSADVRSTIEMAHSLGLHVIAKGVQSQDMLDRAAALGCDGAQGDAVSGPLAEDELIPWIRERASNQPHR